MLVAFTRSPAMTAWRTASCSVGFSSRFIGISTEPRFDTIVQPFNCAAADFPGSRRLSGLGYFHQTWQTVRLPYKLSSLRVLPTGIRSLAVAHSVQTRML